MECELVRVKLLNEARLSEWDLVRDYLAAHRTIRNADVRRILNLGDRSVQASKLLKSWLDKGLLEVDNPDEGKRNRRYRLRVTAKSDLLTDLLSSIKMTFSTTDFGNSEWLDLLNDSGHK